MKQAPRVTHVTDVEKPVYRVLVRPILTPRDAGGYTAAGDTRLRTKSFLKAMRACSEFKGACVVRNDDLVLAHNRNTAIKAGKYGGWGFVFGSALKH